MESVPILVSSEDAETSPILRSSPPESLLDASGNSSAVQFQDDVHALDSHLYPTKCFSSSNIDSLNAYHTDFYDQDILNFDVAGDPKLLFAEQLEGDALRNSPVVEVNKVNTLHKATQSTYYILPEPTQETDEENVTCEASYGLFSDQPRFTVCKRTRTLAQEVPVKPKVNQLEPTDCTGMSESLVPAPGVTFQDALQPESAIDSIISPILALEKLILYKKASVKGCEENMLPEPSIQSLALDRGNLMPQCNFTGRRKALLIGINYFDTPYELKGCINDVRNIKDFLMETYSFPSEGIVVMTDDQSDNPLRMPTRRNILDAMNWLADGARPNDSLFFHFSGHGSQIPDLDGDEEDGYDETICPCDFTKEGMIVDDEMNRILVRPLPAGCRLTALFDCCHSGTALDLPYIYNSQGELKFFQPAQAVVSTLYDLRAKTQKGDLAGAFATLKNGVRMVVRGKTTEINNQRDKGGVADVIMFSSCKDCQTSSDAIRKNVGDSGAMSLALITALRTNPRGLTYLDLLNSVRQVLQKSDFSQVPQLSSARPMDMNSFFRM